MSASRYTRIVIPMNCTLVAAGVRGRTRVAPGASKTCDIAMAKYNAANAMTPVGGFQFTGTSTVGTVALAGGGTAFAAGDVLEMGLYAASAGHAATDYGVTFTFVPTA